jgi:hypothetical protein
MAEVVAKEEKEALPRCARLVVLAIEGVANRAVRSEPPVVQRIGESEADPARKIDHGTCGRVRGVPEPSARPEG